MLHFRQLPFQHQFHLQLVRWDSPWTLMYIWWQNVWSDGTNMFHFQIHQKHDDDGNMHGKICDKHDDTQIQAYQPMPLWWILCGLLANKMHIKIWYIFNAWQNMHDKICMNFTCLENICNYLINRRHHLMCAVYNRWRDILWVFYVRHTKISIVQWQSSVYMCWAHNGLVIEQPIHSIPCKIA